MPWGALPGGLPNPCVLAPRARGLQTAASLLLSACVRGADCPQLTPDQPRITQGKGHAHRAVAICKGPDVQPVHKQLEKLGGQTKPSPRESLGCEGRRLMSLLGWKG